MCNPRILCIDSNAPRLIAVSDWLKAEHFLVDVARTAEEGLEKANQHRPDVIILDVRLDDMDGYELCQLFRRNPKTQETSLLVLTSAGNLDTDTDEAWVFANQVKDQLKGYEAGATEFLNTHLTARELVGRVKAALWASGIEA